MSAYTGTDRMHDRMDKEGDAANSFKSWEVCVLREMRPEEIPEWLWRAQWEFYLFRDTPKKALDDAKKMAVEIGQTTKLKKSGGFYYAMPDDTFYSNSASCKEAIFNFKLRLIKENRYPDISSHAGRVSYEFVTHQKQVINEYKRILADKILPKFEDGIDF